MDTRGTDAVRLTLQFASILAFATFIALLPSVTYTAGPTDIIAVEITRLGKPTSVKLSATSGDLSISASGSTRNSATVEIAVVNGRLVSRLPAGVQNQAAQLVTLAAVSASAAIRVETPGNRQLTVPGVVEVHYANGAIRLVNRLPLEEYVLGVLAAEMPESYPVDALKAQAITIRTYALRNRGKHKSVGCDVCDSQHCQVYAGLVEGKPRSLQAVRETAGLTLAYNGDIAHVFYSADGGGSTHNYAQSRPTLSIPYLCGTRDPEGVVHASWEKSYTLVELGAALAGAGIKEAAGLRSVRVSEVAPTGRVISLEITGATGSVTIPPWTQRDKFGANALRSTLFTVEQTNEGVVRFRGTGYGHGIGLCQAGARALARPPFNYKWDRILAHYFPGTTVASLSSAPLACASSQGVATATRSDSREAPLPVISKSAEKPSEPVKKPDRPIFDVRLADPDLL